MFLNLLPGLVKKVVISLRYFFNFSAVTEAFSGSMHDSGMLYDIAILCHIMQLTDTAAFVILGTDKKTLPFLFYLAKVR